MNNLLEEDLDLPIEIDFRKGIRGLHHIPADAKVNLPELVTEVLRRDIEIGEALK